MSDIQGKAGVSGKVVVVTGASGGIGEATARYLARNGASIVAGARRAEQLETLVAEIRAEGGHAEYVVTDVTRREDVEALTERAISAYGRLDVIVNNAGVMPLSPLEQLKVAEWDQMIDVNIKGTLHGIAAAFPHFKRQGTGHFINVASTAAYAVMPTAAVYCATKFAVRAISEGLRQEVGSAFKVTVVSPGVTESSLSHTISDAEVRKNIDAFRSIAIPADAIARAILFAIEQSYEVDVSEMVVRPTAGTDAVA
ncbi:MAG: SDR family oxidoreductase [Armatimonadota bacterium]